MLEQFTVENFKGFEKLTLEDLGHINIFVGKNNTGKTSLLQAVALNAVVELLKHDLGVGDIPELSEDVNGVMFEKKGALVASVPQLLPKDLRGSLYNKKLTNSLIFDSITTEKVRDTYSLRLVFADLHNSLEKKLALRVVENDLSSALLLESQLAENNQNHTSIISNDFFWYIPSSADFRQMVSQSFGDVTRPNQKKLQLLLKQYIEAQLDEVFHRSDGQLYVTLNSESDEILELPLENMGDGFSKLLSLALILFDPRRKLFFVDEPENGFHYSVQSQFWQLLATAGLEHGKQSFIATHSYELLRNLDELLRNNPHLTKSKEEGGEGLKVRLYRLMRDKDSAPIKVIKLNEDDIASIIEEGWELR